jgi:Outer membrane protein beta-barrel domain
MQYLLRNKITFLVVAVFLIAPFFSFAQIGAELNMEDHDDQRFHFGINLGINRAHYNIQHSPKFLEFDSVNVIESVNSTGINLAWLVNLRLGKHLDIRTYPLNLIFTEKAFQYTLKTPERPRGEDTLTTKKIQGITLALPVQLKFTSDRINNFKVFVMGGGRIEYDLAANAGKKNDEDILTLQKLDYAAEAGIGFHFYFPVFVLTPEIKIAYGLRNVLAPNKLLKYANTIDNIASRSITFSLTIE